MKGGGAVTNVRAKRTKLTQGSICLVSVDICNTVLCIIYELQKWAMLTDQGKNIKKR